MRQDRKSEAGKYKHNDAEHPIWIFDRRTCSLVCFVLRCGPKRYLAPQLLRFNFVLDRIVHLPVPSEKVSQRGKKISESLTPTTGHHRANGTKRGALQQKIKNVDPAKESAETRETSRETMDATSRRCCALLTLTGVDHRRFLKRGAAGRTGQNLLRGGLHLFRLSYEHRVTRVF
jgi:hypothetical protein